MNAKEIGDEAGKIFQYKIPNNFIIRSQEDQNDYGIDYEIELRNEQGKALGQETVFKVQVKGEENCSFINDGRFVSHSIRVDRLKYYLEFKIPVILVVVDVSLDRVFWVSITDNQYINNLVKDTTDKMKNVHLPVENEFIRKDTNCAVKLLHAVKTCWSSIGLRDINEAVEHQILINPERVDECITNLGSSLFKVYHSKLDQLYKQKKYNELFDEASKVMNSQILDARDRLIALMYYDDTFQITPYLHIEKERFEESLKIKHCYLKIGREINDNDFIKFGIGEIRIELFKNLTKSLEAGYLSEKNINENDIFKFLISNFTMKKYYLTYEKLKKIIILLNKLINCNRLDLLSPLALDLSVALLSFNTIHTENGSQESLDFLNKWHKNLLELCLHFSALSKDAYLFSRLYFQFTAHFSTTKEFLEIKKRIMIYDDEFNEIIKVVDGKIEKIDLELKIKQNFSDYTTEEQKQYYIRSAKSLGFDPDDPKSKEGKFVKIALDNYDPSEVVSNCEYLYVHYSPSGLIAELLNMHSLGPCVITCLKYKHIIGSGYNVRLGYYGLGLNRKDESPFFTGFEKYHCKKCSDCNKRPDSWEWSLKWQIQEYEANKEFLDKIRVF